MKKVLAFGLFLVSWAAAAPAQVIEYAHVDALGSVRVVTDSAGRAIERHDYLPYGEEWQPAPPRPEGEPRRFTGKERDGETGLDYFGARFYSSKLGRFTTIDPVYGWKQSLVDPQRWNRYAYVQNRPLRFVDNNGMWPSDPRFPVHQNSIDRVLGFLSLTDRAILKHQQIVADRDQGAAAAPQHAMRNPSQTVAWARGEARDYVRSQLEHARAARRRGDSIAAMQALGNALHAVQDSTSPSHAGFQLWDEAWNRGPGQPNGSKEAQDHVLGELFDPGLTNDHSALDEATLRTYYYYMSDDPLPRDFFGGHDERPKP